MSWNVAGEISCKSFIPLEFKIVGNGGNGLCEDRKQIALDHTILRNEVDRVRIVPTGKIVYCKSPRAVCELLDLVVAFDVCRKIDPEVIGYPVAIAWSVKHPVRATHRIFGHGYSDWPAGAVHSIK